MASVTPGPWQVRDHLIEQPSWGGRYIVDLKGLGSSPDWKDKKIGQSYEMAADAKLLDPASGRAVPVQELIGQNPSGVLGAAVFAKFGSDLSLLIKLTQAKGNSFQVHLPEGKSRGHWKPKPEAWFYLAPGLYTFGMKRDTSFGAYSRVLRTIADEMARLSSEVVAGKRDLDEARRQADERIRTLDAYAYVNMIEAETDDVIDLTAGGIHHSWEENAERFPQGNLVYEVQVDVPDELCSMRGFDKGKMLDDGHLRPVHVEDYLATIEQDDFHNDIAQHVRKPTIVETTSAGKVEKIFRTPYFDTDRLTVSPGQGLSQNAADGFHHVFVHSGTPSVGSTRLSQGRSYFIPAITGDYRVAAGSEPAVLFKTTLPVG